MPKPVSPDLGRSVQKISGNSRHETGRIAWRLDFSCGFALGATTNYSLQARCQVTHPLMTGGDRGTSLAELREGQDLLKPKLKPFQFIPKFWQAAAIQHEAREPHPT